MLKSDHIEIEIYIRLIGDKDTWQLKSDHIEIEIS